MQRFGGNSGYSTNQNCAEATALVDSGSLVMSSPEKRCFFVTQFRLASILSQA